MAVTAALCWLLAASLSLAAAELELAHVIFRHGQRTPVDTYPNDPHINFSFDHVGWGQLTNKGKLQEYHLGTFLRERYNTFLGDLYKPEYVSTQSTDADRTKMSAQLVLAGLWPPNEAQTWNPNLKWQPIPINVEPLNQDSLLLVRVPCGRYYEMFKEVMDSDEVKHTLAGYDVDTLYQRLTQLTGLNISTPEDLLSLQGTLKAESDYGLQLPEWTKEFYPEKLDAVAGYAFTLNAYTKALQKIKGGPLLKKILTDSKAKATGTLKPKGKKIYLYAGHDSTISNLLLTMGVWDQQVPEYGIMIMIELHKDPTTQQYAVEMFLRNSTTHEPYPLVPPGCRHHCPLDQFVTLTADVIPDDLTATCKAKDPNFKPPAASGP